MAGRNTPAALRARSSDAAVALKGMIRRIVLTDTGQHGVLQGAGYVNIIPGSEAAIAEALGGPERELWGDLESFGIAGFYSRPRVGTAEAVLVNVGASDDHPLVIATKDQTLEVRLEQDELIITTSQARIKITKTGKVELGDKNVSLVPVKGVATGITKDSWGVPLFAGGVSTTVFSK